MGKWHYFPNPKYKTRIIKEKQFSALIAFLSAPLLYNKTATMKEGFE